LVELSMSQIITTGIKHHSNSVDLNDDSWFFKHGLHETNHREG